MNMDRIVARNMIQNSNRRGQGEEIVVVQEYDSCSISDEVPDKVCQTSYQSSSGLYRADDPLGAECNETSPFNKRGRRRLKGLYTNCPHEIIASDVPNNDLGVIQNFRDVVKGLKGAPGTERLVTAAFADPLTLTFPSSATETGIPCVGVILTFNFEVASTQALIISVQADRVANIFGGASVAAPERDVTLKYLAGCTVVELFLPFAMANVSSSVWGPRAGLITATGGGADSRVVITGLPAGAGTATVQWVSNYSPALERIAGAINNV